jgi:hypothetical protein
MSERIPPTVESKQDCGQPHHLHSIEVHGEQKVFIHLDETPVSCAEFIRMISMPPTRGKPCHFLSKRQHMLHQVKWGRHEAHRHLAAGLGANPHTGVKHQEALARHDADEAEARAMPELFHCAWCSEVFEPRPFPNNEHATMFCNTIVLPGGTFLKPDHTLDGKPMELLRAICPSCLARSKFAETAEHDWDLHDYLAKPTEPAEPRA